MATAIYIDAEAGQTAVNFRETAEQILKQLGYEWLPPWIGASSIVARSNFDRELRRAALSADVVLVRFGSAMLEDHWAFEELGRLNEYGGRLVVVLDAANRFAKARLDARLLRPSFVVSGPESLALTIAAALPPVVRPE